MNGVFSPPTLNPLRAVPKDPHMKPTICTIVMIAFCLSAAAGAYVWATSLIDSLYAYRSPLQNSAPVPGPSVGDPLSRRVVFVLIDALRYDTSIQASMMPFLNELRSQGASATMHSRPPSFSEPGYTVLLTGAWPELSDGPAINLDYEQIPTFTQDNLFSAAQRAGLRTAVSGYYWFEKLIPQQAVSDSFYTPGEDRQADQQVIEAALPWLANPADALVLIHIDQVDYAGHHEGGPAGPNWAAAATRADDLLRQVAAQLDFEKDTLLIASDHGQIDRGGHGGPEPITLVEPFVLVGAGVRPGDYGDIQMVDLAPTVAALLGLNIPAAAQGSVQTEMLNMPPAQLERITALTAQQQAGLLKAYATAMGKDMPAIEAAQSTADGFVGADPVTASYQKALDNLHASRLNAERLPRAALALLLALIPMAALYALVRKNRISGAGLAWLVGGALLFMALFNLRYAVFDRLTYSLSSVVGANELILYCAITAGVAFLISWLVVILALRLPGRRPPLG